MVRLDWDPDCLLGTERIRQIQYHHDKRLHHQQIYCVLVKYDSGRQTPPTSNRDKLQIIKPWQHACRQLTENNQHHSTLSCAALPFWRDLIKLSIVSADSFLVWYTSPLNYNSASLIWTFSFVQVFVLEYKLQVDSYFLPLLDLKKVTEITTM